MSDRQTDIERLRRDVRDAEQAIIDLNRKLTDAIIAKRATGALSTDLEKRMAERNSMLDRLKRLSAARGE